jgi:hypothetical protein
MDLPQPKLKTLEKWPVLTEDDEIWQAWIKESDLEDFIGLINANVRSSLRRRALLLLFVPNPDLIPENICPRGWFSEYNYFENLKKIQGNLLADDYYFISSLIIEVRDYNDNLDWSYRHLIAIGYKEYNKCIQELLKRLPVASLIAEALFSRYLFFIRDEDMRYWFRLFMTDPEIDEKWRLKADEKMRRYVEAEAQKNAKVKKSKRNFPLAESYAEVVCTIIFNKLPFIRQEYTEVFLRDQFEFLFSISAKEVIKRYALTIYDLLQGEEFVKTREMLVQWLVKQKSSFSPLKEFFELVHKILQDYGNKSAKIKKYFEKQLQEMEQALAKSLREIELEETERQARQARLARLLAAMK